MNGALLNGQVMGLASGYFRNKLYKGASPVIMEHMSARDAFGSQKAVEILILGNVY